MFVIGILADFSGVPLTALPRLHNRRFVTITRESFAQFLAAVRPRLTPTVRSDDAPESTRKLELAFTELDDFQCQGVMRILQKLNGLDASSIEGLAQLVVREESFQKMHATWAGLKYLVDSTAGYPNVKIRVLNVSKRDLLRDLQRAPEFDQSAFFKLVFAQEIGSFGGEPFGCVLGDYYLTSSHEDAELARGISKVMAAAGAPFLCGVQFDPADLPVWEPASAPLPTHSDDKLSTRTWWDHKHEWSEGWALFLLMPEMRPKGETPLANGYGLPSAKVPQLSDPWLNPSYLVASAVADAFRGDDIKAIAEALFPDWASSRVIPSEMPCGAAADLVTSPRSTARSGLKLLDSEFKLGVPDFMRKLLAECGLNALSSAQVQRRDFLRSLTPVALPNLRLPRSNLAQVLLGCSLVNGLRQHLRLMKPSTNIDEARREVNSCLMRLTFDRITWRRLLPIERFSVTSDGSHVRIDLTFLPSASPHGSMSPFVFRI